MNAAKLLVVDPPTNLMNQNIDLKVGKIILTTNGLQITWTCLDMR